MAISLLQEFLLLTLEDEGGQFDTVPEIFLTCGVAGAVLMDLALQDRIDADPSALWVVDPTPTGDVVLDQVLAQLGAEPKRLDAGTWLRKLSKTALELRQTAIHGLCDAGILRQEKSGFQWVMESRKYPVEQGREMVEAKRRIMSLIFSNDIPAPRDCALVSLAASSLVFERTLTKSMFAQTRDRIEQLQKLDLIGGSISTAAKEFTAELKKGERGAIVGGIVGNVVEWYDFCIYGYFATVIGPLFFPATNTAATLMATFGVFAVGFMGRPIGAIIIGHVADRIDRRQAVILSVMLMVIPSTIMGLLPTYAQIGVWAPLALVVMRFLQGIAVGGEYSSSAVLLVEAALPGRRGFISSLANVGGTIGTMLGSGVGALVMAYLPAAWGWRVAFLFGMVLGVVVFFIRRALPHSETIAEVHKSRTVPVVEIFRNHWREVLQMGGLQISGFIAFYLCNVYLVTWLIENTKLNASTILYINALALGVTLIADPFFSAVSDRTGRKPLLVIGSVLMAAVTVPMFMLMQGAGAAFVLIGQVVLIVMMTAMGGGSTVYMAEVFPPHLRTSGMAISLNLTAVLFGGTVPLLAVWLTKMTGNPLAPAWYLVVAALLTAVAAIPMRNLDRRHAH